MESHSKACCSISPIVSNAYKPKGAYETIHGMKTYITGPSSATAILYIYDIFGFYPQTIQGADILAYSDNNRPYKVFMPDFFEGEPVPMAWFPPDNEEKKKLLGSWFENHGFEKYIPKIAAMLEGYEQRYPAIKSWNVIGACWGGKLVSLTSKADSPWKAAAQIHPAMVDPQDALEISIPTCVLASMDENPDDIKSFEANLRGERFFETFGDQIHGWMAARADLDDERVRGEYERGYELVLQFFGKYSGA